MTTAISTRPATTADLEALLRIEQSSFQGDRLSRRQMRYLLVRGRALTRVAVVGAQVVAYALVLTPATPRPARLYSLAVDPDWRGHGIAARLLEETMHCLRALGVTRYRLEVSVNNTAAAALYRRFGFASIAPLPAYYQDGSDGTRMECLLNAKPLPPPGG